MADLACPCFPLVYRDFAEHGPDRLYRPGTTLRSSGTSQAPLAILRLAAGPYLQRLVEHVNESANLVVLSGTDVRFVTTVECTQVLRAGDRAGKALPAHLTSAGKAILALLDEQRVSWILSHPARPSAAGPTGSWPPHSTTATRLTTSAPKPG